MLVAAIDMGSNSTRLLIADCTSEKIKEVYRDKITTRLGSGITEQKKLTREAQKRQLEAVKKIQNKIKEFSVAVVKIVGTSALRDLKNSEILTKQIKQILGYLPEIVSGKKEAYLIHKGVVSRMEEPDSLIIDIGGGSSEFIWCQDGNLKFESLNIGAVRMTNKFIKNPSEKLIKKENKELKHFIENKFEDVLPSEIDRKKLIGVGGTITTLGAIKCQVKKYDREKIHNTTISLSWINELLEKLAGLTLEERKEVVGLEPERADIIITGVVILVLIMSRYNFEELIVCEYDILYGIISQYLSS